MDSFIKLLELLFAKISDPMVVVMIALIGYLFYERQKINREHKEDVDKYVDSVKKMSEDMLGRSDQHNQSIMEIVNRYHDDKISINEALERIRLVLVNMGGKL